jgi:hypothetical protein
MKAKCSVWKVLNAPVSYSVVIVQNMKTYCGSRAIVPLIVNLSTKLTWVVPFTSLLPTPPLPPPNKGHTAHTTQAVGSTPTASPGILQRPKSPTCQKLNATSNSHLVTIPTRLHSSTLNISVGYTEAYLNARSWMSLTCQNKYSGIKLKASGMCCCILGK